jgi:mRNA interferase RelE/StbE
MKWKINYSRYAENFLKKNDIRDDIRRDLVKFLKKMRGESINIDVKKLKGSWKDYYRLRRGKVRIIFDVDYKDRSLFVEKIDFRGEVYK